MHLSVLLDVFTRPHPVFDHFVSDARVNPCNRLLIVLLIKETKLICQRNITILDSFILESPDHGFFKFGVEQFRFFGFEVQFFSDIMVEAILGL